MTTNTGEMFIAMLEEGLVLCLFLTLDPELYPVVFLKLDALPDP